MAENSPKIEIKDFTKPIINTRLRYLEENDKKIKGRKGFLFGSFVNEKERIKKAVEDNSWLNCKSMEIPNTKSQNHSPSTIDANKFSTGCYQPHMRFKPRTDLERIYDSINLNFYGRADPDVVNRQLSSLNLNTPKKTNLIDMKISSPLLNKNSNENESKLNFPSYLIHSTKHPEDETIEAKTSKKKNPCKKIKLYYRKPLNIESRKIINDFNYKTHFKAVESIALHPNEIISQVHSGNRSEAKRKEDFFNEIDDNEKSNTITYLESKQLYPYVNNRSFYYSRNPIMKKNFSQADMDKLSTLKQIAFKEDNKDGVMNSISKNKQNTKGEEDTKREEYKIKIGNDVYYMNYQMGLIANKILNKCNVHHNKNKNNMNSLRSGEGKLMMTKGMTVKNFVSKYKLS